MFDLNSQDSNNNNEEQHNNGYTGICPQCGKPFANSKFGKYCSRKCIHKANTTFEGNFVIWWQRFIFTFIVCFLIVGVYLCVCAFYPPASKLLYFLKDCCERIIYFFEFL